MFLATLKRAFFSKQFFVALFGTVIMCYICAKDYMADTNMPYTYIIELIINLSMFKKIMVFFSAFPFVCVYCKDNNSKYINSILIRCRKNAYIISNIIACTLSSFISTFSGILIFALSISGKYSNFIGFECIYCDSVIQNQILYVFIIVSVFSLYCTIWSIAGLAFSSILPDIFIALGSPLIFGYLLEELTCKLPRHINLYILSHCSKVIDDSPLLNYIYTILVFIFLIILFGTIFSYFAKRRIKNEMV